MLNFTLTERFIKEWHCYRVDSVSYLIITTMKMSTQTTVLLKAIDIELKKIIEQDLQKYRAAQQAKKNKQFLKELLAA